MEKASCLPLSNNSTIFPLDLHPINNTLCSDRNCRKYLNENIAYNSKEEINRIGLNGQSTSYYNSAEYVFESLLGSKVENASGNLTEIFSKKVESNNDTSATGGNIMNKLKNIKSQENECEAKLQPPENSEFISPVVVKREPTVHLDRISISKEELDKATQYYSARKDTSSQECKWKSYLKGTEIINHDSSKRSLHYEEYIDFNPRVILRDICRSHGMKKNGQSAQMNSRRIVGGTGRKVLHCQQQMSEDEEEKSGIETNKKKEPDGNFTIDSRVGPIVKRDACDTSALEEDRQDIHAEISVKNKSIITCDLCPEIITDRRKLISHMRTHFLEEANQSTRLNEEIICQLCGKAFLNKYKYLRHLQRHNYPVSKCGDCGKLFKSKSSFATHKHVHSGDFRCRKCGKTFATKTELETHDRIHTGIKPFSCLECGKKFTQQSNLRTHMRGVHSSNKPFKCSLCPSSFKLKQSYKGHVESVHFKNKIKCFICDELFSSRGTLYTHMENLHTNIRFIPCKICGKLVQARNIKHHESLHSEEREKFKCNECGKEITTKSHLVTHLNMHAGLRPFICHVCGSRFTQKSHLRTHSAIHSSEPKFQCNDCEKSFNQKSSLHSHLRQHTGVRPFACKICAKRYYNQSSLQVHMKASHTSRESWQHVCKECGMRFYNVSRLNIHFENVHRTKNDASTSLVGCNTCGKIVRDRYFKNHQSTHVNSAERKGFECHECYKILKTKTSLANHLSLHSGFKPFRCSKCSLRFVNSYSLTIHLKSHFAEYKFSCNDCSKVFYRKEHLVVHCRRHVNRRDFTCFICEKSYYDKKTLKKHITTKHSV